MKSFLFRVVIFLVPLVLGSVIVEFMLRNIPNDYTFKKELTSLNSNEIEVLILGSSHALTGLNPDFFDFNTFNASHVSQKIYHDLELFKKYVTRMPKLKCLVIPIGYATLFKMENVAEWRDKNYNIYYDLKINYVFSNYFEIFSVPFRQNLLRLHNWYNLNKSEITVDSLGFPLTVTQRNLEETGSSMAIRQTSLNPEKFEDKKIGSLYDIISEANRKDISVLFYTSPGYKSFAKNLNQDQINLTIRTMEKLSGDFEHCFYLNLLEDKLFVESDFKDGDHLNFIGAQKLSKQLNEYLISIIDQ